MKVVRENQTAWKQFAKDAYENNGTEKYSYPIGEHIQSHQKVFKFTKFMRKLSNDRRYKKGTSAWNGSKQFSLLLGN